MLGKWIKGVNLYQILFSMKVVLEKEISKNNNHSIKKFPRYVRFEHCQ